MGGHGVSLHFRHGLAGSLLAGLHPVREDRKRFRREFGETLSLRLRATEPTVWSNLHIVPYAACVAVVGALVLSANRRRLAVGNDLWLWFVVVASLVALLVTYVFGAPEIHWWLSTSANRTTISRTSVPTPTSPYGSRSPWRRGNARRRRLRMPRRNVRAQVNLRKRFRDAPHERRQPIRDPTWFFTAGGCNTLSGVDGQVDQFDEAGPPSLWIQTVLYRQTTSEISALVRGLNAAARFARAGVRTDRSN